MRTDHVRVALSQGVYDMHGTLPWNDKFKALLSAPYVAGIILHDRRCWLEQFESGRYTDPAVDRFTRERVKVRADSTLQGTAAIVEVQMRDGRVHTDRRNCAKGDPDDPLTREEIQDKLRTAAKGVLPAAQVERIVELIDGLENLADVRELATAVRARG
jgi:2-methylcitrate dehydratase PrpD